MLKKFRNWQLFLGALMIVSSAVVYYIHYLIFHDAHHIFIYLIGDIAFVFIEVLMVTLIIHRLLSYREKKALLKKLNMVIGIFFTEMGTELLQLLINFDCNAEYITHHLVVSSDWTQTRFEEVYSVIRSHHCDIDIKKSDLKNLKQFLVKKKELLLSLLRNPNLLEHESFTDCLWAVSHLTEEFSHRKMTFGLPQKDYEHLAKDIERAYIRLVCEWIDYMKHLKHSYPYLFSLAMRTNPFDQNAKVEIS